MLNRRYAVENRISLGILFFFLLSSQRFSWCVHLDSWHCVGVIRTFFRLHGVHAKELRAAGFDSGSLAPFRSPDAAMPHVQQLETSLPAVYRSLARGAAVREGLGDAFTRLHVSLWISTKRISPDCSIFVDTEFFRRKFLPFIDERNSFLSPLFL